MENRRFVRNSWRDGLRAFLGSITIASQQKSRCDNLTGIIKFSQSYQYCLRETLLVGIKGISSKIGKPVKALARLSQRSINEV
jgi:hypothetical protein